MLNVLIRKSNEVVFLVFFEEPVKVGKLLSSRVVTMLVVVNKSSRV